MITTQQPLSVLPNRDLLLDTDLDLLMTIAQIQSYPTGSLVVQSGQVPATLPFLLSGKLATFGALSNQHPLFMLESSGLVGETLPTDDRPAQTSIQAIEASKVLLLPRQPLLQHLERNQDFAARFYHFLAGNLSQRLREVTTLMAKQQIKEGEPLRKVLMVFATLNDSDVAWMIANGISEKAALETALIQQGKTVPAVYLLLDGILGIYVVVNKDGVNQEIEVAKRVKGDILGEMSFVDGGNASASVKALENAWVLAIPQPTLNAKMQTDRGFASRFYKAIAQILSTRCQDLLIRSTLSGITSKSSERLSDDLEEDEIDFDILEGTAIAATRFDWIIQQLRR